MPTFAEVPSYEDPVYRFLLGRGELKVISDGRAFNIWNALSYLKDADYPLIVGGRSFDRATLLSEAAKLLEERDFSPARMGTGPNELDRIISECVEAGFVDKSLLKDYEDFKRKLAKPE